MAGKQGWIGVDLDGTLAYYDGWISIEHIGAPIPAMLERVKAWLDNGRKVRIFTARVAGQHAGSRVHLRIEAWCQEHLGEVLPITNVKDMQMSELWDDRAVGVVFNEGVPVTPFQMERMEDVSRIVTETIREFFVNQSDPTLSELIKGTNLAASLNTIAFQCHQLRAAQRATGR